MKQNEYLFFECGLGEKLSNEKIREIEEKFGLPFYLFDEKKAMENTKELRQYIGQDIKIAYAMKANPWLAEKILKQADYIEVCSEGELEICKKYDISGSKIILDGVLKDRELLSKAMEYAVLRISIDSRKQLQDIVDIYKGKKMPELFLRVSSGNRFGMEQEEILECVHICQEYNVEITGIQYYPGTQRNSVHQVKTDIKKLFQWLSFFEDDVRTVRLKEIEFGAGIGVPYFCDECYENYKEIISVVADCVENFIGKYKITYEAGRIIAATSGIYVTKVFEKKLISHKKTLLCNGGTNHLSYYGGMFGIRSPKVQGFYNEPTGKNERCMVCGALCNEGDVLIRDCLELDQGISQGDYLVFLSAGAYSATESSNLFLTMEMPMILLYNETEKGFLQSIKMKRAQLPTYTLMIG